MNLDTGMMMSGWFFDQVAVVSDRKVKEAAVRHHTLMWKSLIFSPNTTRWFFFVVFLFFFFFSQIVSEIFMQGDIYAWSVIKSAYTESDGLD